MQDKYYLNVGGINLEYDPFDEADTQPLITIVPTQFNNGGMACKNINPLLTVNSKDYVDMVDVEMLSVSKEVQSQARRILLDLMYLTASDLKEFVKMHLSGEMDWLSREMLTALNARIDYLETPAGSGASKILKMRPYVQRSEKMLKWFIRFIQQGN